MSVTVITTLLGDTIMSCALSLHALFAWAAQLPVVVAPIRDTFVSDPASAKIRTVHFSLVALESTVES